MFLNTDNYVQGYFFIHNKNAQIYLNLPNMIWHPSFFYVWTFNVEEVFY